MIKHIIEKCSSPGWTKEFSCEYDARQELLKHVCGECLTNQYTYMGEGGKLVTEQDNNEPINIHNIRDLLGTACGCEYNYEEVGDDYC